MTLFASKRAIAIFLALVLPGTVLVTTRYMLLVQITWLWVALTVIFTAAATLLTWVTFGWTSDNREEGVRRAPTPPYRRP